MIKNNQGCGDPYQIKPIGLHLVEASAGTGKTTLLSVLFLKAVIVWNLPVERIAVITFTRAATQELLTRIRKDLRDLRGHLSPTIDGTSPLKGSLPIVPLLDLLKDVPYEEAIDRTDRAILDFDRVEIRTIHSFYQSLLSEFSHLAGLTGDREVITRTDPYVFEATTQFLREELERLNPALRRYWFEKGIPFLSLFNGSYQEFPKPDPSQLTSRIIGLSQGGWPVSPDDLLEGPDNDLLEKTFSDVLECGKKVAELSYLEPSSHRDLLLGDTNFPFQLLKLGEPFKSTIEKNLGFKTCKTPLLKEAIGNLLDAIESLRELWANASKAFVRRMLVKVGNILEKKKETSRFSFQDDALLILLGILEREEKENPEFPALWPVHKAIRAKYDFFLVDEFQDTDPHQISLLLKIGKDFPALSPVSSPAMVFVGDPKQSIYRFRGADLQSYLQVRERMGENLYRLLSSYRQSAPLLSALNFLYSKHPSPFCNPQIKAPGVLCASSKNSLLEVSGEELAPMRILVREDQASKALPSVDPDGAADQEEDAVAKVIAREILRILSPSSNAKIGENPVNPAEVAILVRKTKEAHLMEKELELLGISSLVEKDGSVLSTAEARELEWILLAILGRGGASSLFSALTSDLVGEDFQKLMEIKSDLEAKEERLRVFSLLRTEWENQGVYRMGASMIASLSIKKNLEGRVNGKRKWINLNHLLELLNRWESDESLLPERLLARFSRAIRRPSEFQIADEEFLREEGASTAVRIMTVHKAKGLEFDIVFCPFVQKQGKTSYPLKKRGSSLNLLSPPELFFKDELTKEDLEEIEEESFSEELRVLYVALTRARYHVTVVLNDKLGKGGGLPVSNPSPLLWLLLGCVDTFSPETLREDFSVPNDLTLWSLAKMAERLSGGTIVAADLTLIAPFQPSHLKKNVLTERGTDEGSAPITPFPDFEGWVNESFTSIVHFFEDQILQENPLLNPEEFFLKSTPRGGLPKGARTGTLIHELLENSDIDPASSQWIEFVQSKLELRGFDPVEDLKNTTELLSACLETVIDGKSLKIGEIPREKRIRELVFSFPLEGYSLSRFTSLLKSLSIPLPEEWSLAPRSHDGLRGMLSGAVDLFFFHEGQVAFVDYKTNDLGMKPSDYSQESLHASLVSGGYFLQALLYSVALDRHMKACMGESYSYERDFGGGYFLFLRGLLPPRDTMDQGVYKFRFPVESIRAVEAFFEGKREGLP